MLQRYIELLSKLGNERSLFRWCSCPENVIHAEQGLDRLLWRCADLLKGLLIGSEDRFEPVSSFCAFLVSGNSTLIAGIALVPSLLHLGIERRPMLVGNLLVQAFWRFNGSGFHRLTGQRLGFDRLLSVRGDLAQCLWLEFAIRRTLADRLFRRLFGFYRFF